MTDSNKKYLFWYIMCFFFNLDDIHKERQWLFVCCLREAESIIINR